MEMEKSKARCLRVTGAQGWGLILYLVGQLLQQSCHTSATAYSIFWLCAQGRLHLPW